MLIEPASKVSVPFVVVTRTLSRVAEVAFCPATDEQVLFAAVPAIVPEPIQLFVDASIRVKTM